MNNSEEIGFGQILTMQMHSVINLLFQTMNSHRGNDVKIVLEGYETIGETVDSDFL